MALIEKEIELQVVSTPAVPQEVDNNTSVGTSVDDEAEYSAFSSATSVDSLVLG